MLYYLSYSIEDIVAIKTITALLQFSYICPRSSVDRAFASDAMCAGSIPVEGTMNYTPSQLLTVVMGCLLYTLYIIV